MPGLNACIKQVAARATGNGWEVLGLRKGWESLVAYKIGEPSWNKQWQIPLNRIAVRTIDRSGGTFLHSSRTNPAKMREADMFDHLVKTDIEYPADVTDHVLAALDDLEVDALVTIGGDDTLSYSAHLHDSGFPVVAIPKTMDNDVYGTDYCIGFGTAVTRSVDAITQLRTPIGSHERIGVIELFGRNSGETTLISSYLSGVDRSVISEVPFDMKKLAAMLSDDKDSNPSSYSIVTISEGAVEIGGNIVEGGQEDAYGHKKLGGIGRYVADQIKQITGHDIMYQSLAYLMRCGAPDSLDRMVAMNFATMAVGQLLRKQSGTMTALQKGRYVAVPLDEVISGTRSVDVGRYYDANEYRPKIECVVGLQTFLE